MGVLKSFHEPLIEQSTSENGRRLDREIISVIEELVEHHSDLLSDVEGKRVERRVLETEVVRIVDRLGNLARRDKMIKQIMDHMFGYGILQSVLEDESVSGLIVTRYDHLYVKRLGEIFRLPIKFESNREFENYCKLIVIRNGGLLNETDSHARVSDEALRLRINATIAPRSQGGPSLSIRKHRFVSYDLDTLKSMGMMDTEAHSLIANMALSEKRFVIVGKGGSGKTTLLRAILNLIGDSQRLLICESETELFPDSPSFVVQRIVRHRQPDFRVTLEHLVRDGLTMSLDGYVVGELTGSEAWEFIKAGYTDHRIMGTLHSGGIEETPIRIMMLSDLSKKGISEKTAMKIITSSLDRVIYMKNFRVERIAEVMRPLPGVEEQVSFNLLYERRS